MSTGKRIKEARNHLGLTQAELAKKVGVSRTSVMQWERDEVANIRNEYLLKISHLTGYSFQYLFTGDEPKMAETVNAGIASISVKTYPATVTHTPNIIKEDPPEDSAYILGPIATWDSDTPLNQDEVSLPFYKKVEAAAGIGNSSNDEHTQYALRFSKATLKRLNISPENAVCITVTGNSMEDRLPDGATVGIDMGDKIVRDGKVYAIRHGDMIRVKVLYRVPGGGIRLHSYNSAEHPDETYSSEQIIEQDIEIIGKVFWSSTLW